MSRREILGYIENQWNELTYDMPRDQGIRIGLPNPYVTPSSDIFEGDQFYWDSFFIIIGLVWEGKIRLAQGMVDNFVFLFRKYRVIPSRNRLYNLGGTQPPFLTTMASVIYEKTKDWNWYKKVMSTAEEELNNYWLYQDKLENHVFPDGLVRYIDHYVNHITAEHESGWDMTSRFYNHCINFAPIDLNCLIYKYEIDLAKFYEEDKDEKKAREYYRRANHRKALINQFMWDKKEGFYFDYNVETKKRSTFYSLAGYYPLWVGIADEEKAEKLKDKLSFFEYPGGLANTQNKDLLEERQWDWPNGWAPLQLIVVEGLMKYGFGEDAKRIAEKWVNLISEYYEKTGKIYEKYNVVDSCLAKSERYQHQEGFGWTNAVFLHFVRLFDLDPKWEKGKEVAEMTAEA